MTATTAEMLSVEPAAYASPTNFLAAASAEPSGRARDTATQSQACWSVSTSHTPSHARMRKRSSGRSRRSLTVGSARSSSGSISPGGSVGGLATTGEAMGTVTERSQGRSSTGGQPPAAAGAEMRGEEGAACAETVRATGPVVPVGRGGRGATGAVQVEAVASAAAAVVASVACRMEGDADPFLSDTPLGAPPSPAGTSAPPTPIPAPSLASPSAAVASLSISAFTRASAAARTHDCLKAASPSERDVASIIWVRRCVTRQHRPPKITWPPTRSMRSRSPCTSGLWSSVNRVATFRSPEHSTARESPTCATKRRPPPTKATSAHDPDSLSLARNSSSVSTKASRSAGATRPSAKDSAQARRRWTESAAKRAQAPPPWPS
eukprot:scaffold1884_cov109-Isochrysis_galbana.AAC.9